MRQKSTAKAKRTVEKWNESPVVRSAPLHLHRLAPETLHRRQESPTKAQGYPRKLAWATSHSAQRKGRHTRQPSVPNNKSISSQEHYRYGFTTVGDQRQPAVCSYHRRKQVNFRKLLMRFFLIQQQIYHAVAAH